MINWIIWHSQAINYWLIIFFSIWFISIVYIDIMERIQMKRNAKIRKELRIKKENYEKEEFLRRLRNQMAILSWEDDYEYEKNKRY